MKIRRVCQQLENKQQRNKQKPTINVDLGNFVNQRNGHQQQQHRGSEAVKLWAEIWNFTCESWSGIPDFSLKLLCLMAPVLLLLTTVQLFHEVT